MPASINVSSVEVDDDILQETGKWLVDDCKVEDNAFSLTLTDKV